MQRNITQSQIQSLKTHPHIKKLQKINNRLLQLVYYPKDIKSHYAKSQYRLKIELPMKYPQQPPSIKFIDPIKHINISDKNGEVTMPILVEDWSPYISLYIIIDLIDAILVEPELSPRYCIGGQTENNRGVFKGQENLRKTNNKVEDLPLFNTEQQYDEISVIRKASHTQRRQDALEEAKMPIGTMKKKLKKLKTMILQKSFNMDEKHVFHTPNIKIDQQIDKIPQQQSLIVNQNSQFEVTQGKKFTKRTKKQQMPENFKRIPKLPSKFQSSKDFDQMIDRGAPQLNKQKVASPQYLSRVRSQNKMDNYTAKKQKDINNREESNRGLTSTIYFQSTTKNLNRINCIIELFTAQLYQLEKKKSHTKNDHFARMIQKKVQQQIAMIEELQELSSTVKKSMISDLKKQLHK